jgi:hypothetical protein
MPTVGQALEDAAYGAAAGVVSKGVKTAAGAILPEGTKALVSESKVAKTVADVGTSVLTKSYLAPLSAAREASAAEPGTVSRTEAASRLRPGGGKRRKVQAGSGVRHGLFDPLPGKSVVGDVAEVVGRVCASGVVLAMWAIMPGDEGPPPPSPEPQPAEDE